MVKYTATIEDILKQNHFHSVIDYMQNIRKDIEEQHWCSYDEVHDATRWAENELNTQAETIAKLTTELKEARAEIDNLQTVIADSKAYKLMLTDGSDESTAPLPLRDVWFQIVKTEGLYTEEYEKGNLYLVEVGSDPMNSYPTKQECINWIMGHDKINPIVNDETGEQRYTVEQLEAPQGMTGNWYGVRDAKTNDILYTSNQWIKAHEKALKLGHEIVIKSTAPCFREYEAGYRELLGHYVYDGWTREIVLFDLDSAEIAHLNAEQLNKEAHASVQETDS